MDRAVWRTGGRFGGSWRYSLTERDIDDITLGASPNGIDTGPTEIHEQRLFLNYTHPLLRNRGGIQDTLPLRLQTQQVEITTLRSEETAERFFLDATLRFIDWALQDELLRIAKERLDLATEQRTHQEKKQKLNLVEQLDVLRATASETTSHTTLTLAENAWQTSQSDIAELTDNPAVLKLRPKHDLYTFDNIPLLNKADIEKSSRLIRSHQLRLNQLQAEEDASENEIRPFLDLTLQGGLRSGEESFSDASDLELPEAAIHLTYRHMLGSRAAKENQQRLRLETQKEKKRSEETRRNLFATCYTLHARLTGLKKVLTLNKKQIDILSQQAAEERRLQEQGRNDLIFVIQAEDQLRNTQLIYAQNAAQFQKLLFQLKAELDQFAIPPDTAE